MNIKKAKIPETKEPIWKNFSIYGKFGFNFDIFADIVNHSQDTGIILHCYEKNYLFEYKYNATINDKKINILLNAGIGIAYRFKNGLGLSFEGEYYAGLRTMGHVFIDFYKYIKNPCNELIDGYSNDK